MSGRVHLKKKLDMSLHICDPVIWTVDWCDGSSNIYLPMELKEFFLFVCFVFNLLFRRQYRVITRNLYIVIRRTWNDLSPPVFFLFRHFLFKTSSGTTPLFSSSSPGYPLTSGTVYSPPPRLLPRNTFSRSAFKLKKPSKYCSWKCAAVTAIAAAALLAILLSYFIGKRTRTTYYSWGGLITVCF